MKCEIHQVHCLLTILVVLSLIHGFIESRRLGDSGFRNALMVAVCFWPLGYVFWILYWPGTFWRRLAGRPRLERTVPVPRRY